MTGKKKADTISVIAALQAMGVNDYDTIAHTLDLTHVDIARLYRRNAGEIARKRQLRLLVSLPKPVRCPTCLQRVNVAPCIGCEIESRKLLQRQSVLVTTKQPATHLR